MASRQNRSGRKDAYASGTLGNVFQPIKEGPGRQRNQPRARAADAVTAKRDVLRDQVASETNVGRPDIIMGAQAQRPQPEIAGPEPMTRRRNRNQPQTSTQAPLKQRRYRSQAAEAPVINHAAIAPRTPPPAAPDTPGRSQDVPLPPSGVNPANRAAPNRPTANPASVRSRGMRFRNQF